MIYQVGKKQCSNSGRKRNDIAPLESDFMVQPPSLLEFPGPLTPPPPWNFQFPPWWGSGYFLELHNAVSVGYVQYYSIIMRTITFHTIHVHVGALENYTKSNNNYNQNQNSNG